MKTQSVVNTRLVEDKERLLLNFVFSLWFEKELKKVNSGLNGKKKKRYAKLDPFKMVIEPPVVFKDNFFYACAADRPGGTLLVDKKIPYLTLETFLEKSKPSGDASTGSGTLAEAIEGKKISFEILEELIKSVDNLSSSPAFYITKMYTFPQKEPASGETESEDASESEEGKDDTGSGTDDGTDTGTSGDKGESGNTDGEGEGGDTGGDESEVTESDGYYVIYDSKETAPDFDTLVSQVFRDYTFEEISFEAMELGDENIPASTPTSSNENTFFTGKVTVKDSTLKEKSIILQFIDLYLLANLFGEGGEVEPTDSKLIEVTPTDYDQTDPSANKLKTGITLKVSDTVEDDDVELTNVTDDLGNDVTASSTLAISTNQENTLDGDVTVDPYPFAFAFKYPEHGERRRLFATMKLKSEDNNGQKGTLEVDYNLADESLIPVIEKLDISNGLSEAILDVSFTDTDQVAIPNVVPQDFGQTYTMFDADATNVRFADTKTELVNASTLRMKVALGGYGSTVFKFADAALKSTTVDVIDPSSPVTVKLIEQQYADGDVTLTYNLIQNDTVLVDNNKAFAENGTPIITVDDVEYTPKTTWTDEGFINVYSLGAGDVYAEGVVVAGKVVIGINQVEADFTDTIQIGQKEESNIIAQITAVALNGGYIYPGAEKTTENVLTGSVIVISDANQVTTNDLELTTLIDATGTDIKNKASVVFTALNDEGTQFSPVITLTNYQWPMSFDNQGSNGSMTAGFGIKNKSGSEKKSSASYKLNYSAESILPRPISAKLTNNSLNNASIYVGFIDEWYNVFESGVEQTLSINPPLFANSQITYLGKPITYGRDDDNQYGAYIPVNFGKFGNVSFQLADTQFKTVETSVADPQGKYSLQYYKEEFSQSGTFILRFRLYLNNSLYTIHDGKVINDSLKLSIDSQEAKIDGVGWEYDNVEGAILTIYTTLADNVNKGSFDIDVNGTWYIGINNVGVDLTYSGGHSEV